MKTPKRLLLLAAAIVLVVLTALRLQIAGTTPARWLAAWFLVQLMAATAGWLHFARLRALFELTRAVHEVRKVPPN